jgi:hypothetical protein
MAYKRTPPPLAGSRSLDDMTMLQLKSQIGLATFLFSLHLFIGLQLFHSMPWLNQNFQIKRLKLLFFGFIYAFIYF